MRRLLTFSLIVLGPPSLAQTLSPQSADFLRALDGGRRPQVPETLNSVQATAENIAAAPTGEGAFDEVYFRQTGYVFSVKYNTFVSRRFNNQGLVADLVSFIRERSNEFGVSPDQLKVTDVQDLRLTESIRSISFSVTLQGLVVNGAHVTITLAQVTDGRWALRSVTNQSYPGLAVLGQERAELSREQLQMLTGFIEVRIVSQEPIVFPVSKSGDIDLYYATKIRFVNSESEDTYDIVVKNSDHSVLEAFKYKLANSTSFEVDVYHSSYLNTEKTPYPLAKTTFTLGGKSYTTDARGQTDLYQSGTAKFTLQSVLAKMVNAATGATMTVQGTVQVGQHNRLQPSDDNELRASNAFMAIHRINQFARRYLTTSQTSYLNRTLRVSVNAAQSCNAYYDGNITLLGAGSNCANMALVNSVIFHEWGHGLDDYTGKVRGITDSAYSEGIGDIIAAYYLGTPNMGEGFYIGQTQGIRNLNNTRRYPRDVTNQQHSDGLIIGGAFWSLRVALIERYGEVKGAEIANKLFFKHLLVSDSYREAYAAVIDLDDDDGNPATRSPNYCLISAAFAKHGLSNQAACEDLTTGPEYPLDQSATMALEIPGRDDIGLAVSTKLISARAAWICLNGKVGCSGTNRRELKLEGRGDERLFFVSEEKLTLSSLQQILIFFANDSGQVIGGRKLKVAPH